LLQACLANILRGENMTNKFKSAVISAAAFMLVLTGCSSGTPSTTAKDTAPEAVKETTKDTAKEAVKEVKADPVTLKFYAHVAEMDEAMFKTYVSDVVKKKHPNITLEFSSGNVANLNKLMTAGEIPDIIYSGSDNYMALKAADVIYDLTDMIKANKVDLSLFTQGSIETLKNLGEGKVTALPFSKNSAALFYNKDLFDKFGVAYPTNGMTYDQVIAIARQMTRMQDGIQYIGWEPGFPDANASPFSQPFVDMKTKKALIDTPAYKKVFEMMKQGYEIPGFIGPNNLFRYAPKTFIADHTVAMYVDWYNKMMTQVIAADEGNISPNWDIVTVPNFPEYAQVGRHESVQFLTLTKQTKYKEQALQAILATTSKEAQMLQSRNGRISILSDPEIQKQFGKDVKGYEGKHMENLFLFKAAPSAQATLYDDDMRAIIRNVAKEISIGKKDVNTALREAQEIADKKLIELMPK
jgi:multiple sugar transport system substrate-binding protein